MKRTLCIALLIAFSTIEVLAQAAALTKTGTTAASFLKIPVGSRAIAMGGAFTAVSNDVTSIFWNPAGLSRFPENQAMFSHVDWLLDVNFDVAAASINVEGFGSLGVMFGIVTMGAMDITTVEQPEGTGETFNAGSTVVLLSYARNLTDKFSIGFNAKYINEYIWNESASSIALDIGTLYEAPLFNGLRLGASVSNFGPKMAMDGRDIMRLFGTGPTKSNLVNSTIITDSYDLPLLFRVGMSTEAMKTDDLRLTVAVDAIHPNDNTEYVNSGLEFAWQEIVSIRGGWKSAFERGGEQGLTLGGGLSYMLDADLGIGVDYAYQDFGRLKEVHYFTIGLKF